MIDQYAILKELDFERLAGTEGEAKGRQIICNYLKQLQVNYHAEEFKFTGFTPGTATITANNTSWQGVPYGLCPNATVKGQLYFTEHPKQFKFSPGACRNKIILAANLNRGMLGFLYQHGALAVINIGGPYKGASSLSLRQQQHTDNQFIPAICVSYQQAEELLQLHGQEVELTIQQQVYPATGHNIVVDLPGTNPDGNLTMAVGHYDSVAHSHGSLDNAAGCVNLLGLVEHFSQNPPRRDLRVVFFSGEELGLLGSTAYVQQHLDDVKQQVSLVVNIDLSGDIIGKNLLFGICTPGALGWAAATSREIGIMLDDHLSIYSSDAMPFAQYEIPSFNIARAHGKGLFHCHTAADTVALAHPRGLQQTFTVAQTVLERLLNGIIYPVERAIDKSLRSKIENYLWHSRLEQPKLDWEPAYKK